MAQRNWDMPKATPSHNFDNFLKLSLTKISDIYWCLVEREWKQIGLADTLQFRIMRGNNKFSISSRLDSSLQFLFYDKISKTS